MNPQGTDPVSAKTTPMSTVSPAAGLTARSLFLRDEIFKNVSKQTPPGLKKSFEGFDLEVIAIEPGREPDGEKILRLLQMHGGRPLGGPALNNAILNTQSSGSKAVLQDIAARVLIRLTDKTGKSCRFIVPVISYGNSSKVSFSSTNITPCSPEEEETFISWKKKTGDFSRERCELNMPASAEPFNELDLTISRILSAFPTDFSSSMPQTGNELVEVLFNQGSVFLKIADREFPDGSSIKVSSPDKKEICSLQVKDVVTPDRRALSGIFTSSPDLLPKIYEGFLKLLQENPLAQGSQRKVLIISTSLGKLASTLILPEIQLKDPGKTGSLLIRSYPSSEYLPEGSKSLLIKGSSLSFAEGAFSSAFRATFNTSLPEGFILSVVKPV